MPTRPPKATQNSIAKQTERERKRTVDLRRPNSSARGYDHEWRKTRDQFLRFNRVCSHPDCQSTATEVDHILSVNERPDLRLVWVNLRAYCKPHHSARTARDQGFAKRKET